MTKDVLDLSERLDFTFALLDDTWAWRQRLVERFQFGSMNQVQVESTYQIEFPPALTRQYRGRRRADVAKVLLPLTRRTKTPLIGFNVLGPQASATHLLLRESIARIQAEYLGLLMNDCVARRALRASLPKEILEAICVFSPGVFNEFAAREPDERSAIERYLREGLGFALPPSVLDRCLGLQAECGLVLSERLAESPEPTSSSDCVLLALPRVEPIPQDAAAVVELVEGFHAAVRAAADAHDERDEFFLEILGEYGRSWEVIIELEAPLDEPLTVTAVEERPLNLGRRRRATHPMNFVDARSYHLEARLTDHAVRIADFQLQYASGEPLEFPYVEGARQTDETVTTYSAVRDRPYDVQLQVRLLPTRLLRFAALGIEILVLSAIFAAATVPSGPSLVGALALLTLPTTFAVAILLVREQTSLATWLLRASRERLLIWTAVLWCVALFRLALRIPWVHS